MKIGIVAFSSAWQSLNHVRQTTAVALTRHHELQPFPRGYELASHGRQPELLKGWLTSCDAVVGPGNKEVLQARQGLERPVPYVCFLLGTMSRGAQSLRTLHRYLQTSDVLVVNCVADAVLCTKFFPNATVRVVPFAFDDSQFYPPDEAAKTAMRTILGIEPGEKIVLYSGRITLEKNLHTVLKTFKIVLNAVPEARLVIAGDEMNLPFLEFGANPLGIKRSLRRLRAHLGLDGGRVLLVGQRTPDELRALYGTADVLVNLTLHHDENFGLSQVEAMACGLPVVGTTWGGLKDTIIDGVTGAQVPALVTTAGVKVDWWHAANSIVQLLAPGEPKQQMRQRCSTMAQERYSTTRYGEHLNDVLLHCTAAARHSCEPLKPSLFADEFWATCGWSAHERPPYRRGRNAFGLYQELITPFAAQPTSGTLPNGPHAWCLAAPLMICPDDTISVNDPIFPFEIPVPEHLMKSVRALSSWFTDQPVLLAQTLAEAGPELNQALSWMHEAGLVLRTGIGTLDVDFARGALGQPVFVIQKIDSRIDVAWLS